MDDPYFARFPGFQPDPSASAKGEFARLARHMNWGQRSKSYKKEWSKFAASEFRRHFGTQNKLQNWQALCREVRLEAPLTTITQCRKALSKVHVNLVDLIDSSRTGTAVHKFPNVVALRKYTYETEKIFPKQAAKQDGFLKDLLRKMM